MGTGTQRNRRSDEVKCSWKPRNDNVSPVGQSARAYYRMPVGGVGVEAQPVIRLSEQIQGWISEVKVVKNEEEK